MLLDATGLQREVCVPGSEDAGFCRSLAVSPHWLPA